tara:strand:- start:571 stop:1164 length:594 start_codon:yes stop_codon:yes gene_type:complete
MIDLIITLAMKFWQWTILIAVVLIGWLINILDKRRENKLKFSYTELPSMQALKIPTKGKGFWGGIICWLLATRNWKVTKDFHYAIDGTDYVIPAGFQFDGASIPKFLRTFFSPVGVLLIGGLIHDYAYKYKTLLEKNKKKTMGELTQKRADEIFRDININVNGFYSMNYLAYWSLRLGGFVAWNGHRKRNNKIPELK